MRKSVALRRLVRIANGGTPTPEQDNWNGEVPWATPVDLGRMNGSTLTVTGRNLTRKGAISGSTIAPKGSVLLSTRAPIGYVAINTVPMAFNQGCKALIPSEDVSASFLRYALAHVEPQLQAMGQGSTFLELSAAALASVEIPLPPADLQIHLANFLDRETAQIDEMISKQERLIELLAEKRQATITHAVTRGLDPNAPTKASGVPWLGDIPASWSVSKLSWKSRGIGDGLHGTPIYSDHGSIPFVNGTNLLGGAIRITDSTNFVEQDQLSVADVGLDESTVLISINGTIGNCAVLGDQQVMLSKSAAYVKCAESLNVHFLAHYLRSDPTRSYFFASSGGTTIANLSLATLRGTPVPVPPIQIQEEITGWLNTRLHSFDELGAKASEAVRLLRERRSALISAAVTGKIDVRERVS